MFLTNILVNKIFVEVILILLAKQEIERGEGRRGDLDELAKTID